MHFSRSVPTFMELWSLYLLKSHIRYTFGSYVEAHVGRDQSQSYTIGYDLRLQSGTVLFVFCLCPYPFR